MNSGLWLKISIGVLLLLIYLSIFRMEWVSLVRQGDLASLYNQIKSLDSLLFITFLLMILQNTFTFIPMALIIVVNVTFFGFFFGLLWSLFSSLIGCLICFLLSRYLFQSIVMKKVDFKIKEKIEENGFTFVFISRLLIFVPTSLINMTAGITSISMRKFMLATLLGKGIYIFTFSFVTYGFLSLENGESIILYSAVLIALLIFITGVIKKKATEKVHQL